MLGVDIIEAGFPAASPGDFEAVRTVSQNVSCGVAALCRCTEVDIKRGWEAVKYAKLPRLHLLLATSEIHMKYKLNMEPKEVLERIAHGVALAKSLCGDVEFSCEDGSRTVPEFLFKAIETAINAGASTVNIADTVGYAVPEEFGALISSAIQNVPNIGGAVVSVHCHNDLGLAVANTLAAVENGARQIEVTINGIGERAGNCSLDEVIMTLATRGARYGLFHAIDTTKIYRTSQRVASYTKVPVPVCKAIVGANAFAHESGIHQHGMLKNPMTYEIMTPQSVGKTASTIVLGKLSGRHAFESRLSEMGYSLSKAEIDAAFSRFKELADRKKDVTDEDIEALVSNLAAVPEFYRLESFQIQSGNKIQAMASVTLLHDDEAVSEAATGDGPIDAAYKAAARIIGGDWRLNTYEIKAVTGGMDALGEVTVRVLHEGQVYVGSGLSTDIIEASIFAYVNAVNRAVFSKARNA